MKSGYGDWLISFDNDGTLSDTARLRDEANAVAAKELNLPYFPGLGAQMYLRTAPLVWADTFEEQYKIFEEKYFPVSAAIWNRPECVGKVQLFPGIKEMLTELGEMGFRICVTTSNPALHAVDVLKRSRVIHLICKIVSCADMGIKDKPSTAALERISKDTGVCPGNIIHIGDIPHDITMARNFGCKSIGIGYGGYPGADRIPVEGPNAMVDAAEKIRNIPMIAEYLANERR